MDSLNSDMKGRTLQPISMSSLEKANWRRGSEWRLNSKSRVILMLNQTGAGLASTREARRTQDFSLRSFSFLQSFPPYLKSDFPRRHHRQQEVGQLTWNNYKHLPLKNRKTNTQASKQTIFSMCVCVRQTAKL